MKKIKLDLKPGKKLLLQPESCMDTEPEPEFTVILESVSDDGYIVIGAPIHKSIYYPLSIGETIDLHYIDADKSGVASFRCTVAERLEAGELRYIKAKAASDITVVQRRDNFRVQTSLVGTVSAQCQQGEETHSLECTCLCADISAGGAELYISGAELAVGDHISVSLPIGADDQTKELRSEIMWRTDSLRIGYQTRVGMMFLYSDNHQQDIVLKYVLRRQQQIIRNRRVR